MFDLWALLGFVGPLLLPPVIPPGPLAGAFLVGLAVYNVYQLLQPPDAPENGRPPGSKPPGGEDYVYTRDGQAKIRAVLNRYTTDAPTGLETPYETFVHEEILNPGDSFSVPESRQTEDIYKQDPPWYSVPSVPFVGSITNAEGEPRNVVFFLVGGFPVTSRPSGEYTHPQANTTVIWEVTGLEVISLNDGSSTTPTPNLVPFDFLVPKPKRETPLAPPIPVPPLSPPRPTTPDKADPTTPDGRPGTNPDGTPASPTQPGVQPGPSPGPLVAPGPTPGGGTPSLPPAPQVGGVVRTDGVTEPPLTGPQAIGKPGLSQARKLRNTTNDGQVLPQPAPGPATTPSGQKTIAGTQVQPLRVPQTLVGIAQELGRVESKLESLIRGADRLGNPTNQLENLKNLLDLAQYLADLLTADVPATNYEITAPCDKDANGNPLKFRRSFPAEDYMPATLRRTEAILDALATLARWKQRTCAPLGGQPVNNVTITAYEVMEP